MNKDSSFLRQLVENANKCGATIEIEEDTENGLKVRPYSVDAYGDSDQTVSQAAVLSIAATRPGGKPLLKIQYEDYQEPVFASAYGWILGALLTPME